MFQALEEAVHAKNPHLITLATLTGHAVSSASKLGFLRPGRAQKCRFRAEQAVKPTFRPKTKTDFETLVRDLFCSMLW